MKINNKYVGIGIIFLLIILFINYNNTIVPLYPEDNGIITERQPTFKWDGKANKLIIDDNVEFVSPIIEDVGDSPYQIKDKLNFTTYYWKLFGNKHSSVSQFTVQSLVALSLNDEGGWYNIANAGNTDLEVEIYQKNKSLWKITGSFVLEQNKTKQVNTNSTLLIAKEK